MNDGPLELRVFGLDIAVKIQPERRDAVAHQWSWCRPDSPSQRVISVLPSPPRQVAGSTASDSSDAGPSLAPIVVERGEDCPDRGVDASDYTLTTMLTGRAIAARAGELVMLHAGGVSDPTTGVVAGLVAASGTGKTTATRFYCTNGYGYVTDETLIFNDRREVLPYPKPLSVIADPSAVGVKEQHCPTDLGLALPPEGDLRLGPLILLDRVRDGEPMESARPDARDGVAASTNAVDAGTEGDGTTARAQLLEMPLFEALAQILPQSSAMPQIDGCLDLLARVAVAGGGVMRLRYREIADTLPALVAAFEAAPVEPFWRHVPGTWWSSQPDIDPYLATTRPVVLATDGGAPTDDAFAQGSAPTDDSTDVLHPDEVVSLAPFVDALVDDDALEVLALVGSVPAHLLGLGAVIWLTLLDGPCTIEQLVAACTAELGDHPDAQSLVARAARDLVTNGVVHVGA